MNNLMTKSFLNYVDLKKQALKDSESEPDLESGFGSLTRSEEENLSLFFAEVDPIQSEMDSIPALLLDLTRVHSEYKSAHSPKLLRGLRDQMESDVAAILRKAHVIKTGLAALNASNAAYRATFGEGTHVDRTQMTVTNGLRTKLRELMNGFNSLRERILEEHKAGLKRRYFNDTGREAGEAELEEMERVGSVVIGSGTELGSEMEERERAVGELRRSLTRLHQVFLDMAVVVETQGEEVNDIEENVARARQFISGGTGRLAAAEAARRGNRRSWVWCWGWSLVLIVILICLMLGFRD